jgi:threonine synthase
VGWRGLESYIELHGDAPLAVALETAHPAKFPDEIGEMLHITPELPPSMKDIDARTGEPVIMDGDYGRFREYLLKNLKANE